MSEFLHIDVSFKRKNFSLQTKTSIPDGIIGVFGPSGGGKSSLLKLICGIETPDDGLIELNGRTLFSKTDKVNVSVRKRKIGLVFQDGRLFPHMTVKKNLLYGYSVDSKFSFDEVVRLLEIDTLIDKKPSECSGGERQRVAIGRMLLHSPEVLLLDEPFSALDHRLRRNIIPFLLRIREKYKLPIFIVSHDLSDLLMLCDQMVLLENGRITGIGSYFDLVLNQNENCGLENSYIINCIKVEIQSIVHTEGFVSFKYNERYPENIMVTNNLEGVSANSRLFFSLFPEDITLSRARVEGISAQNQLEGHLVKLKVTDDHLLCLIDVGFQLLVKVTSRSAKDIFLQEGEKVYCLFKSSAIKNIFVINA